MRYVVWLAPGTQRTQRLSFMLGDHCIAYPLCHVSRVAAQVAQGLALPAFVCSYCNKKSIQLAVVRYCNNIWYNGSIL